ncbi:DUF2500 family protein [Paenibacillus sp. PL2-23]|uniref:DUF2500 family protein n=1 Tax=Paenibacillus sp. PL2-23 TaxID=2100729 RepID=UPI0030F56CFE
MTVERYAALCMVVIISSLFLMMLFRDFQARKREEKLAVEVARARVVGKRKEKAPKNRRIPPSTLYYATFDIRGELVEFALHSDVHYERLEIGQAGTLHFQRQHWSSMFIAFHQDEQAANKAYVQ